jgi:glycosyltransferase involved in cell wall biosynthesis
MFFLMLKPIFFSIILPTYNRAHLISFTLESILSQGYRDYEVIIVDDGSTDDTEEVVQKFLSHNVTYHKRANAERAASRNFGTSIARGDYINWFDSDDIMFPNHLQIAYNNILELKNPEILTLGYQSQTLEGYVFYKSFYPENVNLSLYKGNPFAIDSIFVRKDIAAENLFIEDRALSASEDYELWIRLGAQYPIYTSQEITVAFINHSGRSVITMSDSSKLIERFTKFLHYTLSNQQIVGFLGEQRKVFEMKNYLLLAVNLAVNNHMKQSTHFLWKAVSTSPKFIFERGFYAFIKHYFRRSISF